MASHFEKFNISVIEYPSFYWMLTGVFDLFVIFWLISGSMHDNMGFEGLELILKYFKEVMKRKTIPTPSLVSTTEPNLEGDFL